MTSLHGNKKGLMNAKQSKYCLIITKEVHSNMEHVSNKKASGLEVNAIARSSYSKSIIKFKAPVFKEPGLIILE